jgi:GNAT superfamily N-acetyltransferase
MQEVARLLPDAVAEMAPGVTPNMMKAIRFITGIATGTIPDWFFCIAESGGAVVGFLQGVIDSDAFSDRKYARDLYLWVKPDSRGTTVYQDMLSAFHLWAKDKGAVDVRITRPASDMAGMPGYERGFTVFVRKV